MKYFLFVTGCQQNIYDSERIAHLLNKMGYVLGSEKNANLIIVISCSVRQKPIDRIWGKLKNWHAITPRPKIIVTGCLLFRDRQKILPKIDAFIPADKIEKDLPKLLAISHLPLVDIKKPIAKSQQPKANSQQPTAKSQQPTASSYVPIIYGCDNFCTYCAVPYTRGREHSKPVEEIITEIKNLVKNGTTEVTLLGQNVNSYKLSNSQQLKANDSKSDFVKLLEQIEKIERLKKISFLTSHPKDVGNDLIDWMGKSKKFSHELHLPLQSGNDEILRRMNRNYTASDYLKLVVNIKSKIPASPTGGSNLKLTTDVIVGFPSETKEQFEDSYKLCKKIGFNGAYISQYSPRSGTPSAKMENDISPAEKKRRWKILDQLINQKPTS